MKLYVGNLPYSVTEEKLQQHFAQHGSVVSARIITDKFSGRSKGFGFVELSSDEEAEGASAALNGTDFEGRIIVVSEVRPPADRPGPAFMQERPTTIHEDIMAIFGCVVVLWLMVAFSAPLFPASQQEQIKNKLATSLLVEAAVYAFSTRDIRAEQLSGNNVRLYVPKIAFENVPYPDRKTTIAYISKQWCNRVGHGLLPTVYFYDIRTGAFLDRYDCALH